jgi:hypothetical protein
MMPATQTRISTDESYGPWRVLSIESKKHNGKLVFNVRCSSCGYERQMESASLCKSKAKKSTHCLKCFHVGKGHRPPRNPRSSPHCRQCEDMSWARPADGSPCRCGKVFERELIERPDFGIKSSAGFDNVAFTGRRLVGFCTVGELHPRVAR